MSARNVFLDSFNNHPTFAKAVAAAHARSQITHAIPVERAAMAAEPVDHAANKNHPANIRVEAIRWNARVDVHNARCLSHLSHVGMVRCNWYQLARCACGNLAGMLVSVMRYFANYDAKGKERSNPCSVRWSR